MKILFLIPTLDGGGAERQLIYLVERLIACKEEVCVAYLHDGVYTDRLKKSNCVLNKIPSSGNYDPLVMFRILRLIRNFGPDVIHTWLPQMNIFGGLCALLAGKPFVLSERSNGQGIENTWRGWVIRRIAQKASLIVANSESGAAYWRLRTCRPVKVIRNIIPFGEIDSINAVSPGDIDVPSGARVILYVGRYSEEKNILILFTALAEVAGKHPDVYVFFYGEGALKLVLLDRLADSQHAARIRIHGFTSDVWQRMKQAAVFVSVSKYEGSPNVVLESVACGCPVVLSDIAPHREILDDDCAFFVDEKSPLSIAAGVEMALNSKERSDVFASRARERLSDVHSSVAVLKQYMDVYDWSRKNAVEAVG